MAVSKINGFRAPYRSATFRELADKQTGRNGLLEIGGVVTQVGSTVTVPAFTAVQQGLIYTKDLSTILSAPSLAAPYYVVVSAPTPGKIDNLIFTYAKGPSDVTVNQTLIAMFDGTEWRNMPLISIDGIIKQHDQENIETRRIGPYTGLQTSLVGTDYVTTPGSLIDKSGQHQQFEDTFVTPVVAEDPDWKRVDRILYRRPTDSENRIGYRKFVLGGAFAPTPVSIYSTNFFDSSATRNQIKSVIAPDNTAHLFCTSGSAGSYALTYSKVSSDRQSVLIPAVDIIPAVSELEFDVAIDASGILHVVYISGGDVKYQQVSDAGVLVGSSYTADTQTGACRYPRCKIDEGNFKLYIVYQSLVGSLNQIYFASRDVVTGAVATIATLITETAGAINNLKNPDLFITPDYVLYVVWENATDTAVYYRRFNDIAVAIDAAPIKLSDNVNYGAGLLTGGAINPRVIVADNQVPFFSFMQNKGAGTYGLTIAGPDGAVMSDIFASTENFTGYDLYIDPVFNSPALILSRASALVDFVRIHDGAVSFSINLSSSAANGVGLVRDNLGSFVTTWTTSAGGHASKTVAESLDHAYSRVELESDILLARLVQPGDIVLNWVFEGRPGSFYDFLTAYGTSVQINWGLVAPGVLHMGSGLKILDLYSDTSYTVASGDYTMGEGDALYVTLDGYTLSVTPQVMPVAVLPWETDIAVLGFIKENEFNPMLLGVAGMSQLDDGESVIFGEDLSESVRARLGIINETSYQAYTSTIAQSGSDTYPQALSALDLMSGQNRHVRPVRLDASWCVSANHVLRFDSPCFIQVPSLTEERNTIASQSITLANDGDVAYVSLNRQAGIAAQLVVSVAQASALTLTRDRFILARRVGENLVVDSLGRLYKPGDSITEVYDEPVKPVRVITRTLTALPTGSSVTIDGVSLADGDKVLFANTLINKIYILTGVGSSVSWVESLEFDGTSSPTRKSTVHIYDGADINRTLWGYDSVKGWYRISTLEDFIAVRAADFTTTFLPSGAGPLVVDGVTINEGDLVLYGNAALNMVYRVTGIGTSLAFETVNVFEGLLAPGDGSLVLAEDGSVSDVMWEYNEELPGWTHLSLTAQNKIYLGLTNPAKDGGEYENQFFSGQLNNVVTEGQPLEKAIKALDIRPDVLKRVRVIDLTSAALPIGPTITIDGVVLLNGDKVLFGNPSLPEGTGIFTITNTGYSLIWEKLYEFAGWLDPQPSSAVLVTEGTHSNRTIWLYNEDITPPWERVAGASENIWTGADAVTPPTFDGALSPADTDMAKALATLDKYFRSLQLREHPTDKHLVVLTGSETIKTDDTALGKLINSRIMAFNGAEIDFLNGIIYENDGVTIIGSFAPPVVPLPEYFWYGVSFKLQLPLSNNTIVPTIQIDLGSTTGIDKDSAPRPFFTGDFVIGAVYVQGAGPGIYDILQENIVQIGESNPAGVNDRLDTLEAIVSIHTTEINELQNSIAAILANTPKRQVFISPPGGTSIFDLSPLIFSVENDNLRMDVDFFIDGRWQPQSLLGDFTEGAYRKNSTTQLETAEIVSEGKEVIVLKRDAGGIFANAVKIQRFIATVGGQSTFDLNPLVFTVLDDNTELDADYYINGRWQKQTVTGDFADGAVRKNSLTQVETAEPVPEGQEFTVVRRTPNGGSGGGGGGGGTDLQNIAVDLGFLSANSVGTLAKPAGSVILKDTVSTDIWKISMASGVLQIVKIN